MGERGRKNDKRRGKKGEIEIENEGKYKSGKKIIWTKIYIM